MHVLVRGNAFINVVLLRISGKYAVPSYWHKVQDDDKIEGCLYSMTSFFFLSQCVDARAVFSPEAGAKEKKLFFTLQNDVSFAPLTFFTP